MGRTYYKYTNAEKETIYLGGPSVTVENGYPVLPGQTFETFSDKEVLPVTYSVKRGSISPLMVMMERTDCNSSLHKKDDPVNSPSHYTWHPKGIACIDVVEDFPYNIACAIQYLWRAERKGGVEDLEKAVWHISRRIKELNRTKT